MTFDRFKASRIDRLRGDVRWALGFLPEVLAGVAFGAFLLIITII